MPANRKILTVDPTSEDIDETLDAGRYWSLWGILTGETDTGESVGLDDIADHVIVERNGTQIMNMPAGDLHRIMDEWKGTVENTAPTADDTRIVIPIPFWYPEEEANALNVQTDQELSVQIQFNQSTLSTRFGSNAASFELRRYLLSSTPENYVPFWKRSTLSLASGDTGKRDEFTDRGIVRLFLDDASSVVTRAQVEFDDRVLVNNADLDSVNDLANLLNRVESSPDDLVEVNPFQGPDGQGASRQTASVTVDASGAGNLVTTRIVRR